MSERKPCPICLGTDSNLTDEDVTPVWVRKILADQLLPDPQMRPPKTKVRICSSCNAAMNNKFEIPCRDLVGTLIRGENSVVLTPEQMAQVSAWVTKTTLVRIVGDSKLPTYPQMATAAREALVQLIETGRPSLSTSVRIAYFSMEIEPPWQKAIPARAFVVPRSVKSNDNVLVAYPSLGCLKWELVMSLTDGRSSIERLLKVEMDADRLLRIWPLTQPDQSASWPPPVRLDMAAVAEHTKAWSSGADGSYYTEKTWRGTE